MDKNAIFATLQLQDDHPGVCQGPNQWLSNPSASIQSINPATGEPLARVTLATQADLQSLVADAQQTFLDWRAIPAPQRGDIVRQIGDALREHKAALGALVSLEMGKSLAEGEGEVQEMIDIADFAVGQSRMLYGLTMPSERPHHRMFEQWHPYGVIGVITAFNFPVAVWSWNALLAAVCGNVIIWKPSEKTPLCALAVQHLCNQVLAKNQVPAIFKLLITDDRRLLDDFTGHPKIPMISFTGSVATGKHVAQRVAARLGRSLLELGGNNGMIIERSANLDLAIPAAVFGAIGTAGQRCTTTRRLLVDEAIYDEVLQRLCKAYQQVRIGDPLDSQQHMGPLIDGDAVEAYREAIQQAQQAGGKIAYGGRVLDRAGYYVEPTLITDLAPTAEIVQEETFAPILYVMRYGKLAEAIATHNAVPQGLSSAIFTQNVRASETFLSYLGSDCGIANVNIGTSGAEIGGAFGGEKATGGGRESGSDAWKSYMRRQTNTINWGDGLPLAQGIQFKLE